MDINLIRAGLSGQLPWFKPGEYTEEDFRKGIAHSVEVTKDLPPHMRSAEELVELVHAAIKLERNPCDEDARLHLHEEIGDALWAIGLMVEKYHLSETTIKYIRKLKDEYEFVKDKEN